MNSKLTHGSLFSGIGSPEIAAEMMGWKNVFHCEINPFGRKILDYWFPNSKSYEDITKTDFREWRGKINVLTGGFPCQPFSCAVGAPHRRDRVFFIAHRADAGSEGMQREWENNILSGRDAPNTDGERCNNRSDNWKERPICYDQKRYSEENQSEQSNGHSFDSNGGEWDATNSNSEKLQEWLKTRRWSDEAENRARMDNGIERFGSLRNAPYSSSEGLSTLRFPTSIEKKKRENEDGCSVQPAGNVRRTSFAERWENFPTQSPVCSRDDGIFTGLDGIAFSKWRQESIKAYGNAIVPQVMYEIFLAIESIEKISENE